jgi:hypothetical protein
MVASERRHVEDQGAHSTQLRFAYSSCRMHKSRLGTDSRYLHPWVGGTAGVFRYPHEGIISG